MESKSTHQFHGALTEVLFSLQTGGSERIGSKIARYAKRRGLPTTVCATHGGPGPISRSLTENGIEWAALQQGVGGRLGRAWRLFRHLRSHGTTVLHAHHFNVLSIALRPARLAGVRRIVVTEHTDYHLRTRPRARRTALRFGGRADLITVVHEGMAEYLTNLGLDPAKIRVIPNGIDTSRFAPGGERSFRAEVGVTDEVCLVGCVGRLHRDKDPLNLVAAVASLSSETRRRLHVVIVGDGELRPEIEKRIADDDLGAHVTLVGERMDVPSLLPSLDVFVLPSRTEGLPVAVLEAMSCGLPVVATSVGGVATAVGEGGIIVPPSDPVALGKAVVELAHDADLRLKLGGKARRRAVERFDVSVMYDAYAQALELAETVSSDTSSGQGLA